MPWAGDFARAGESVTRKDSAQGPGIHQSGYIDPQHIEFAQDRIVQVREVAEQRSDHLKAFYAAYAEIHRNHPFHEAPEFAASLRTVIERANFPSAFNRLKRC